MNIVLQDFASATTTIKGVTTVYRPKNIYAKANSSYLSTIALSNAIEVAEDCQITNIFADLDVDTAQDPALNINLMRVSRRSKVATSRLLALRRQAARCARTLARRPSNKQGDRIAKELRNLRAHIFSDDAPQARQYSLPLRIATHSINMALILAVLPIGAASLTYNLLRGEDIAITARLTTLAGLVLVFVGGQANNLFGAI